MLGLPVLGYFYASRATVFSDTFLAGLIVASLYLAHGYSINQCFDNRVDNSVEMPGDYSIPLNNAILLSSLIFIANLTFTLAYSIRMMPLAAFGGLIAFLYSAPPLRLKKIPFLGLFCNSLCFTPLFLIGYISVRALDLNAILKATFIFILFLPIDLIHQLNDADQDQAKGFKTTVLALGVKNAIGLMTISFLLLNAWLLVISRYMKISYFCSFATLFLSILITFYLIIKFYRYGYDISKYKIKLTTRYLFIIYGIGLLADSYFYR